MCVCVCVCVCIGRWHTAKLSHCQLPSVDSQPWRRNFASDPSLRFSAKHPSMSQPFISRVCNLVMNQTDGFTEEMLGQGRSPPLALGFSLKQWLFRLLLIKSVIS